MTNPKHDETEETEAWLLAGTELRMEISKVLTVITDLVPHVMTLTDSHNPSELGFMTFEARQAQNQIARKERRLRIEGQKHGRPLGHGTTAAPGNIHGLSVDVELWATARHLTRWLTRHGATEYPISDGADTLELLGVITQLVETITDDKVLRATLIDLRPARDAALRLVDGAGSYRPATPCIHCGLLTLVVDKVRGIAICDGDAKTGRISPCICSDPVCGCKTDPIKHRHKWYRNRLKAQDGWLTLTSRIELQQKARNETNPEEPTMTQLVPADQIERIVGALRSPIDHRGRAAEVDQKFYILHSAICLQNYPDLRTCPYSIALDKGITVNHDQRDIPLELDLHVDESGAARIVIVGPVRACRECLCTEDHACTPPCTWATPDLCSTCTAGGAQ